MLTASYLLSVSVLWSLVVWISDSYMLITWVVVFVVHLKLLECPTEGPKWQLEALMTTSYLLVTALYSSDYMLIIWVVVIIDYLKLLKCSIEENRALMTASLDRFKSVCRKKNCWVHQCIPSDFMRFGVINKCTEL